MEPRVRLAFLLLIVVQAAHSFEEFAYRLFDVLAPARFVSGLFSDDLARGFVIANTLLVLFFVWSYVARIRPVHPRGRAFAWGWGLLELGNGISHSLMAVRAGGYFPGVFTAPLLIVISFYLLRRLRDPSR